MTAEASRRPGRKQFPGVAWQPSVIFMSPAHTQVKASPALQVLTGSSVMALRLHTAHWHCRGPRRPSGTGASFTNGPSSCRTRQAWRSLHTWPFALAVPLPRASGSRGKAGANTSIPSFVLCLPSLPPPCCLLEIFTVS